MTNKEIFEFIDRFEKSSLQKMKVSLGDFSLELERGTAAASETGKAMAAPRVITPLDIEEDPAIVSPVVGVFYAAPAPDDDPFVQEGDKVKKGQTVCIMEAMKMMNEVTAPCDCVITEILKDNGELAAFGEPLFRYRPC